VAWVLKKNVDRKKLVIVYNEYKEKKLKYFGHIMRKQ